MSKASFALQYEGEAVESGLMSVRDLAPALLAFGDLCDQANREMNGDRAKVEVKIKTFAPGSVIVDLIVGVSGLGGIAGIATLLHGPAKTANELLDIIKKLIEITKLLRGEKIEAATQLGNGTTQLTVQHNHTHDVSDRVYDLMTKRDVQQDLKQIVAPLKVEGIDRLKMLESREVVETVEAEDAHFFDALPGIVPDADETIVETTSTVEKYYKVVSLSSDPKHVWRLSDGGPPISVTVADHDLHERAKQGGLGIEPGFVVKARIKSETHFEDGEPKTHNTLVAVLEVRPPKHDGSQPLF